MVLCQKNFRRNEMKDLIKSFDNLPWIAKIILCIPVLDIVWAIYRIIKGVANNDAVLIIVGIIWVIGGCTITWVWDLVTTLLYKHPKLA